MTVDSQICIVGWYLSCCLVQSMELLGSIPAGWSCSPHAAHRSFSGHTFLSSVALKGSKALHHFDWNMLPSKCLSTDASSVTLVYYVAKFVLTMKYSNWRLPWDKAGFMGDLSWTASPAPFICKAFYFQSIFCMISFHFSTSQREKTC